MKRATLALMFAAVLAAAGCSKETGAPAASVAAPPPPPPPQRIEAPPRTWTWVPFADARCMNNSGAGISVNPNPGSDRLLIVLQGGSDCVDAKQCGDASKPVDMASALNPAEFGWLARDQPANPFKGWNLVLVPYCTGDLHAGDWPDAKVPFATGPQQFVGWRNMSAYLKRLAATWPNPAQVVLAGCSSGGVGALANFPQVQRTFASTRVTLVADSGPPTPAGDIGGVHAALVKHWRADRTLGRECGAACDNRDTLFMDYFKWLVGQHPNNTFALSDYTEDLAWGPEYGLTSREWKAHVLAVRDVMRASRATGSFIVAGNGHCVSDARTMVGARAGRVRYTDWLTDVIATPAVPIHVGP